jgi:lipopolysaccharide/colanic/teichoic acid biosynthesis glycosyltransferase
MKRLFDILCSFIGLILFSPILIIVIFFVWINDFHSPFYIPFRVGKNGLLFKMVKLRSMIIHADKSKVDSTANDDNRITKVGSFIRSFKLDEIMQLYNVLLGDMSLVGPRPNVQRDTDLYTKQEKKLLTISPGITDFSSIVFSDEGSILEGRDNPDIAYNQLIRPWKSRLGIFYVENRTLLVDIKLIVYTVILIGSRSTALKLVSNLLENLGADSELCSVALREVDLVPTPPPGSNEVVTSRA